MMKKTKFLVATIDMAIKDLLNFVAVLFLFIYVWALVGLQIFSNKLRFDESGWPPAKDYTGKIIIPRANFDDLLGAILSIF